MNSEIIKIKIANGTHVYAGLHRLCIITEATDQKAVEKFIALCKENAEELNKLGIEYDVCLQKNIDGANKNWPIFSKREKVINKLLKQAGIKDL